MVKIRLLQDVNDHIVETVTKYHQMPKLYFIRHYFPDCYRYEYVSENDEADICIVGIQHVDNSLLRDNEFNIMFCVENLATFRPNYAHLHKYNYYENNMIDLFIYNHIPSYDLFHNKIPRSLPIIFFEVVYYNKMKDIMNHLCDVPFEEKKFCLFISQNNLNGNKQQALSLLRKYGDIDFIFNFPELKNKTCYHSIELIKLFNKYKFIITFENSHTHGYITEKIFNVFLAKSIPIYDANNDIDEYINPKSYLKFDSNLPKYLNIVMNNKDVYEWMIKSDKVNVNKNKNYSDVMNYMKINLENKISKKNLKISYDEK